MRTTMQRFMPKPKPRFGIKRAITMLSAGTVAVSAGTYAVRRIMGRRNSESDYQSMKMPRNIRRVASVSRRMGTPIEMRPPLFFDKGNVSRMLDSTKRLQDDSPAAAIALMDFMARHQSGSRHYARSRLTTLLATSSPNAASIRNDRVGRLETEQSDEGHLTSALSHCELTYLGIMHSATPARTRKLTGLASELQGIAQELAKRNSQRRQASARIILADVYLRLGNIEQANDQMSRALVLIGTIYGDPELIKLSTQSNGSDFIERVYQGTTDPSVRQRAHELVNGSKK